jgi:hypothetical protein
MFQLVILLAAAGCSNSEPARYRLSGTANVGGKPIPFGEILFTPDGAQQNSGPQGIATIRDGKFDTSTAGLGIAGGPTVVRVTGFSEQGGKLLCEEELKVDLPRADSTQDFDVPPKPAARPTARPEI